MKRSCITLAFLTTFSIMMFGDTIIFKDGTTQEVYNVEESGKWILYTLEEAPDSELKRIETEKVFAIKPAEGEIMMVGKDDNGMQSSSQNKGEAGNNSSSTTAPQKLEAQPAENNSEIISAYNNVDFRLKKPKKESDKVKYCKDFISLWGISEESILADDNVEISIEPNTLKLAQRTFMRNYPYYQIRISNKTSNPVYIDLANCFKVNTNGISTPYFTNSVYSESTSKGKGGSMNLGGISNALGVGGAVGSIANSINIGGGVTKSANVTTEEQRFLLVPPHSSIYLPPVKFSGGDKILEEYEVLYFRTTRFETSLLTGEGDARRYDELKPYFHAIEETGGFDDSSVTKDVIQAPLGWIRDFNEEDTPKKISRIITYSTSPDFETYTVLPITLYIRGVMGSNNLKGVPTSYTDLFETSDKSRLLWGTGHVEDR